MEYERYYYFLWDETQAVFETYLPIQLDATCNGFQHTALLSNEQGLYEQLNLKSGKEEGSKDLYEFVLRKTQDRLTKLI